MRGMKTRSTVVAQDKVIAEFLSMVSPLTGHIREMYLFGSRCRDDWRPDSDYDVLVVLDRRDRSIIDGLYDAVMDVLLAEGRLISLKIFSESEFAFLKSMETPFVRNVLKEGVKIGSDS